MKQSPTNIDPESTSEETPQVPTSGSHGRLWVILIIGVLLIGYAIMERKRLSFKQGTAHPLVGKSLALVQLQPLDGSDAKLTGADLTGNVVLLNFWGTWCPPCRMEMPHLVEIYSEFRHHSNFQMITVTCEASASTSISELRKETDAYLAELSNPPPVYTDADHVTRRGLVALGETDFSFPTTIVLDPTGTILGYWQGFAPGYEHQQRQLIQRLLTQAESEPAAKSGMFLRPTSGMVAHRQRRLLASPSSPLARTLTRFSRLSYLSSL